MLSIQLCQKSLYPDLSTTSYIEVLHLDTIVLIVIVHVIHQLYQRSLYPDLSTTSYMEVLLRNTIVPMVIVYIVHSAVPEKPLSRPQHHFLRGGLQAQHHRGRRLGELVAVLCLRQLLRGWRRARDLLPQL